MKLLLVEIYVCVPNHIPFTELIERVQVKTKDQFPKFVLRIANKLECLVKKLAQQCCFWFPCSKCWNRLGEAEIALVSVGTFLPPSCDIQSTHYVNIQMWIVKIIEKRKLHLTGFPLSSCTQVKSHSRGLENKDNFLQERQGETLPLLLISVELKLKLLRSAARIGSDSVLFILTDFVSSPISTGEGAYKNCNNSTDYSFNYRR